MQHEHFQSWRLHMKTWISLQKRGRREENFTSPDHSHPDMPGTKTGLLCFWEQNWVFVLLGTKLGFCASVKDSKPLRTDRQTETWWKNCKFCHHLPYPAVWTCNKKSHEISISLVSRSDMKNHKPFKIFPFLPRLLAAFSDYLSLPERKQKNRHTSPKHSCLYSSSSSFFRCVPALPHAVTNWN